MNVRGSGPQELPTRRHVTQQMIDKMVELRHQGFTFAEIAARLGCSERTVRRYAGRVRPRLRIPQGNGEPEADPRALRERFLSKFLEILYHDPQLRSRSMRWVRLSPTELKAVYGDPPSVLFLSEAEQLIREALDGLGDTAVRLMARDKQSQYRFLREVVGHLYRDYVSWHVFEQNFGETGEGWRPLRERPVIEADEDEDL